MDEDSKQSIDERLSTMIGIKINFTIISVCWDDKIMALECNIPEEIQIEEKNHHITFALKEGVRPVYSNEMLKNPVNKIDVNIPIIGEIERVLIG